MALYVAVFGSWSFRRTAKKLSNAHVPFWAYRVSNAKMDLLVFRRSANHRVFQALDMTGMMGRRSTTPARECTVRWASGHRLYWKCQAMIYDLVIGIHISVTQFIHILSRLISDMHIYPCQFLLKDYALSGSRRVYCFPTQTLNTTVDKSAAVVVDSGIKFSGMFAITDSSNHLYCPTGADNPASCLDASEPRPVSAQFHLRVLRCNTHTAPGAYISNRVHYKILDEIAYTLPNFNDATVEVSESTRNFI